MLKSSAPFLTKAIPRKLEPDTIPALGRVSLLGEWPSTLLDYEGSVSVIRSSLRNTQLLLIPRAPLLVHTHCLLCDSLGGNPGSLELSLLLSSIYRCQKRPKSSHCSPATHGSVQNHSKIGIMERIHFHVSSYLPLFTLSRMGPSMNVPGSFLPNPASSQRLHFCSGS